VPKVDSDGVEVSYEMHGAGPPVVLVQGLGGVGRSWQLVVEDLVARGRMVVTLDNRGVGGTYMPRGAEWSVADMASDVIAVADACGLETFHLGGLSMGGMISQEILVTWPERLRSVTLMGTHFGIRSIDPGDPEGPPFVAPSPEALQALLNPVDPEDPEGSARRLVSTMAGPGFVERHPERLDLLFEIGREVPMPMRGFMSQFAAASRWSSWDRLEPGVVPAVVLHGDADPLIPWQNGRNLAERLGAEFRLLPGAGHMLFLEVPDEIARIIDRQMQAHEGR